MESVKLLLKRFVSAVLAFFLAFIPFANGNKTKDPGEAVCKVALVSDVHIDRRLPVGQLALQNCYRDMMGLDPDAVAVLGDLTNYGDKATLERFFEITKAEVKDGVTPVIISGNHDIGHAKDAEGERMNPEALADFVQLANDYLGYNLEHPYYTIEVKGYPFICLNDMSADNWDHPEYTDEALQFLSDELDKYGESGKPMFVLLHVPLSGIHGEENFYPGGGTEEPWSSRIRTMLESHKNVFCLTGHFHKGLSNNIETPTYNLVNGVHYLNLPSYLMPNWPAEYAINGLGFFMEISETAVLFRCRNYYLHNWMDNFDYLCKLV